MLRVENVSKNLGTFCLNNISFHLPKGYIMGLLGLNGAGKTTLMQVIMNIMEKDQGEITIGGYDNQKEEVEAKSLVGYVSGEGAFLPNTTIMQNVKLFAPLYPSFNMELFYEYLEKYKMNTSKYRHGCRYQNLSTVEKVRVQMAFAFAHSPELLLLDEPTANLDPGFRLEFLDELQEWICKEEGSVLFSTHVTSDLDKIGDYVTIIHEGNMVLSKDRESLFDEYQTSSMKEILLWVTGGVANEEC